MTMIMEGWSRSRGNHDLIAGVLFEPREGFRTLQEAMGWQDRWILQVLEWLVVSGFHWGKYWVRCQGAQSARQWEAASIAGKLWPPHWTVPMLTTRTRKPPNQQRNRWVPPTNNQQPALHNLEHCGLQAVGFLWTSEATREPRLEPGTGGKPQVSQERGGWWLVDEQKLWLVDDYRLLVMADDILWSRKPRCLVGQCLKELGSFKPLPLIMTIKRPVEPAATVVMAWKLHGMHGLGVSQG